jgi:endonuclease/exonuclease/phosphatase family metal-dependent hydrolase
MRMRLVSWNVHGCVGTDRRFDPHRTAAALASLEPDLALLQEVGDNRGIHPPVDQATTIAYQLGLTCAVGITLRQGPYGYGNATLTRYPVLDSESVDLSVRGREPRVALRVVIGRDDLRLTTLNVHLGLGPGERRHQLRHLLPAIEQQHPLVLGGDFNDFPPGPVTFTLKNRLFDAGADLKLSRTYPSRHPLLRLDRVYLSSEVRVHAIRIERAAAFRLASDHLPIVVELEVPPLAAEPAADPP